MCTEIRKCKECGEEKTLILEFRFHSATGYYSRKCKVCENKGRRTSRNENVENKTEDGFFIRTKTCILCNETKILNKDTFGQTGGNYSRTCRECKSKHFDTERCKLSTGPLPEDTIKVCSVCKEEKKITEYYYSKTYKNYQARCKKCNSPAKRKMETSLYTAYKHYDFDRGFEFNLTKEYILESLKEPCTYCGYPSTGLDRKDNTKGHTIENTVPCCRSCNTVRMDNFSHEEMFEIGEVIKKVKDKRNGFT